VLLATFICWLQLNYKLIKLGGNTFIIDYYPVKMAMGDYLLVIATVHSSHIGCMDPFKKSQVAVILFEELIHLASNELRG
jgi:hypothetical protein